MAEKAKFTGEDLEIYLELPAEEGGPTMPQDDETQTHFVGKIINEAKKQADNE